MLAHPTLLEKEAETGLVLGHPGVTYTSYFLP